MSVFWMIVFGSGIGGGCRYLVNVMLTRGMGLLGFSLSFPWGIFLINVAGSTLIGFVVGWGAFRAQEGTSSLWLSFLTTGFLGGFTTFSSFSLDLLLLLERGQFPLAGLYGVGSVLVSLLGCYGGIVFFRIWSA